MIKTDEQNQTESEKKKISKKTIVSFVLSAILFLIVLFVFIQFIQARRENRPISIFGYSMSVVVTPSMEPEIMVNDLIFVNEKVKFDEIEVGENAVFISLSGPIQGERIVHKVIEKGTDEEGPYLVTKGVNNAVQDTDKVRESNFVGKEISNLGFLGTIVILLSKVETWILIIVLCFAIPFAVKQVKKIIKYSKEAAEPAKDENKTDDKSVPDEKNDKN